MKRVIQGVVAGFLMFWSGFLCKLAIELFWNHRAGDGAGAVAGAVFLAVLAFAAIVADD